MKIESVAIGSASLRPQDSASQHIDQQRKGPSLVAGSAQEETKVPAEEILTRIKDLTEGGMYSVRFEMNPQDSNKLLIQLVDQKTGKRIRQIPPEDLFQAMKSLGDLSGMLVNTRG